MHIAKENCFLTAVDKKPAGQVGRQIAEGGEAIVYELRQNPEYLIKIYRECKRKDINEYRKLEKKIIAIEQFYPNFHNSFPEICWAKKAVYYNGEFQGFIMRRAKGKTLTRWLKSFRDAKNYNDIPVQQVALKISNIIQKLHNYKLKGEHWPIIIGDIQPQNILVDDALNISILDCDSFQIGGTYCPVQFPTYFSPERLLRPSIGDRRTEDEENYVLAYLFFQMMMFGLIHPYNYIAGPDTHEESIKEGYFPYVCDNGKYVNPALYQRWLGFSPEMQAAFKKAFWDSHPKQNSTRRIKRPTPEEWIDCFEKSIKRGPHRNITVARPSTITVKKHKLNLVKSPPTFTRGLKKRPPRPTPMPQPQWQQPQPQWQPSQPQWQTPPQPQTVSNPSNPNQSSDSDGLDGCGCVIIVIVGVWAYCTYGGVGLAVLLVIVGLLFSFFQENTLKIVGGCFMVLLVIGLLLFLAGL